jgi:hypothetical protein
MEPHTALLCDAHCWVQELYKLDRAVLAECPICVLEREIVKREGADRHIEELEADKKELLRTIENLEDRIRRKEKEINAANKLATQRGARMQIMRAWMVRHHFWQSFPTRTDIKDWFDEDGVPVREGK